MISQHLLFVDFFDDGHSDWCEVIPHCSFDLHCSNNDPIYCIFKTVMFVNLNLRLLDFQKHFDDIAFSCVWIVLLNCQGAYLLLLETRKTSPGRSIYADFIS